MFDDVIGLSPENAARWLSPEGLRGWVKQARTDATGGGEGALTSAVREELAALRRRVREQDQVINILKKAAAFFAQDNL